jgi:ubiquinone/menaquinone biosynthesis C-methylase UbiE
MIQLAAEHLAEFSWLEFQKADVYSYSTTERFDLVTSARTLQWLAHPEQALANMKRWLKPGGVLAILDYNHEKIVWNPAPPASMRRFYNAFLEWRQDAGFDNAIADHLRDMMDRIGLEHIRVEAQFEITSRGDASFPVASRLWAEVAELRGPQLVQAGYVTEAERLQAIDEYVQWIATEGELMEVYLLAVEGCNHKGK